MTELQTHVFKGKDQIDTITKTICLQNFILLYETGDIISDEDAHAFIESISSAYELIDGFTSLEEFDSWIGNFMLKPELPLHIDLAAGYFTNNKAYLKTIGLGEVHIRRNSEFVPIIHSDKSASGYVQQKDMYTFTTKRFRKVIENVEVLEKPLFHAPPLKLVQHLQEYFGEQNDEGIVAIFTQVVSDSSKSAISDSQLVDRQTQTNQAEENADKQRKPFQLSFSKPNFRSFASKPKIVTLIIVIIVFAVLLWSVVFGDSRRKQQEIQQAYEVTQSEIQTKLDEANELAALNLDQSTSLVDQAESLLEELRLEYGEDIDPQLLLQLENQIQSAQSRVTQTEKLEDPEEFYDLALEAENAQGDMMFREENRIVILDSENNVIYNLNAEQKSLETSENDRIAEATAVGLVRGSVIMLLPDAGVFEFTNDTAIEPLIEPGEDDWANIIAMSFYVTNVYLLDESNDEIYKYLPIEGGYSPISSYFSPGEAIDLEGVNSMTIDTSIYLSTEKDIYKFTRGEQDTFDEEFPNDNYSITKIHTSLNENSIYVWDKKNAAVYILDKSGSYRQQIRSSILNEADDMLAYNGDILVLSGSKLYLLSTSDE